MEVCYGQNAEAAAIRYYNSWQSDGIGRLFFQMNQMNSITVRLLSMT